MAGRIPHLLVRNNSTDWPRYVRPTALPERRALKRHSRATTQSLRSRAPQTLWLRTHSLCIRRTIMVNALRKFVGLQPRSYRLRIPRAEENEGLLLLGDPGTGKSQVIHQLLDQIANRERPEAIICYDPAGEFIERHFNPEHDIVLNPLDTRCPYWSPAFEVDYANGTASATDCRLVAESFFPEREQTGTNSQFFVNSARSIFGRLLELQPTAQDIVRVLKN